MSKLFTMICGAALAAFGGLNAQCSGTYSPCSPLDCGAGCDPLPFEIEGTLLYLQPSAANLHYVAEAFPLPLPSPNWQTNDIRPDYHFAFDVGASVHTPGSTKASLNYTNFRSKDSATTIAGTNDMVGPFFEIGPDAALYTRAKGRVSFEFDALDVEYGIDVNFGENLHTNFFAGVAGARIKQGLVSWYSNQDGSVSRKIKMPSSFTGAGPEFGVDFSYAFCDGFRLTGGALAALLVGNLKNHTKYDSVSPALIPLGITPPNKQSTHVHNHTGVVPAFEGKLGLAYCFDICNFLVNLDAGYEVRLYANALQSTDIGSEVNTPPVLPDTIGVYARTFQRHTSNFALAGPYFKLNICF